ncbi:MAG TPA: ELWxxDGT repeat protein [Herpetosiphonaceae bacterium]
MKRIWFAPAMLLLIALAATPAQAGPPARAQGSPAVMLKDINPQQPPALSIGPRNLTVVGETVFFTADDGVHGRELWRTDGTPEGTAMVKDITPGSAGDGPGSLVALNQSTLLFSADDGIHGRELWKTDGTEAGTRLVKDIMPGAGGSRDVFDYNTLLNGVVIFRSNDGRGAEPWRTDGTEAGTRLIKDINPGPGPEWDYGMPKPAAGGGWMYFTTDDGVHGDELWRTDGTAAGTTLVKDVRSGAVGSDIAVMIYANDALYFTSNTGNGIFQMALWRSDGTAAGTAIDRVVSTAGRHGEYQTSLYNLRGALYFIAPYGGGCDLHGPQFEHYFPFCSYGLIEAGDAIFMGAGDEATGAELWRTDGTETGTGIVKDIRPGAGHAYPSHLTFAGGWIFFSAIDGVHGAELWRSDGTESGTSLVQDINPAGDGMSNVGDGAPDGIMVAAGRRLLFVADDGVHGEELWALSLEPDLARRLFIPQIGN